MKTKFFSEQIFRSGLVRGRHQVHRGAGGGDEGHPREELQLLGSVRGSGGGSAQCGEEGGGEGYEEVGCDEGRGKLRRPLPDSQRDE